MRNFIALTLLFILISSCTTSKNTVYKTTDTQIFFGNSGGFTNLTLEYVLNDDGNVFKIEKNSLQFIKKIDRKQFKDIKHAINESEFKTIKLNSPGNMSYFIRVKTNENENKIVWSDISDNEPVKIIYQKLFDSLKD